MIIDDNSKQENLEKITALAKNSNLRTEILNLDHHKYKNVIKEQKNEQTFSNLASLLCCYENAKAHGEDLVFFVEDDYLHFVPMMEEMISSYERISSQLKKDILSAQVIILFVYE